MSLISLGTHLADPAKRLAHIRNASSAMKSTMGRMKSILPTDFPSIGVPWLMEAAVSLYGKAKVADRIPQVANLVISNVPGPQVPLYLAGARVLTNCPTSIVVHGLALNITVQSFDAGMDFGLMADGAALPDVKALALAVDVALDELRTLAPPAATPAASEQAVVVAKRPRARVKVAVRRKAPAAATQPAVKPVTPVRSVSRKRPPARESTPAHATRSR
jgi:diacylglycerol O-acyltransferase